MSEWKARRFWKTVHVKPVEGGSEVMLDARPLRTPGKLSLVLPTQRLAEAVAAEWDAVGDVIVPQDMPLTRAANSAIEKVRPQFDAVAAMLAEYGGTDLLSYRADEPQSLVDLQARGWDPLVDWAARDLNAPLRITHGVLPVEQDGAALERLLAAVRGHDDFGLTALHDLVTLPGSLVLGLAVTRGRLSADEAHDLSRIDENFQSERWGRDDEAEAAAEARREAMRAAERLWQLSRPD
ncbi:ATPase [Paracoccus sp. TK19116]|uniref:ATPase n=1 Tax=Paracoccus albicereus TaxID=2922394 RepID=A0ABT1MT79_9RHOB|nr:ATP12 family protein [Paracoccus albicereus]MCQ0970924.1 ATPase [Paracoccus albicereus]